MLKIDEIRKLSVEEIKARMLDAMTEMENLRIQHSTRQLDNPLRMRYLRKEIARMHTVVQEVEKAKTV
jgi:large subunit ribosomal protein L29